jgi:hypothetical protein
VGNNPLIEMVKHSVSLGIGLLILPYQLAGGSVVLLEKTLINLWVVFDTGGTRKNGKEPEKKKGKEEGSSWATFHDGLHS